MTMKPYSIRGFICWSSPQESNFPRKIFSTCRQKHPADLQICWNLPSSAVAKIQLCMTGRKQLHSGNLTVFGADCCKWPSEAACFQELEEAVHANILQAVMHPYLGAPLVRLLVNGAAYFLDIVLSALLQIAILELLYILLITSSSTRGGVLNTMTQVRCVAVCNRHLAAN